MFSPHTSYSCPAGQTVSGSTCVQNNGTVAATANYSCPVNHTLSGTNCARTSDTYAALITTSAADRTVNYVYGPEHQRVRQSLALSGNGTSAYFAGSTWYLNGEDSLGLTYEREVRDNGLTLQRHFLSAGGVVFAQLTKETGIGAGPNQSRYLHYDHLGSIAAISDATGTVVERLAYDPWGKRRSSNGVADPLDALVGVNTDRGYTLHEHIDEVGIINMNGRVYDPLIGRFMSADPLVPNPFNLKSFNRYS